MGSGPRKLTIADQVLVNYGAFLVSLRVSAGREDDIALAKSVIADVLPSISDHPAVSRVAEAAQELLDGDEAKAWRDLALAQALAEFFRWRAAMAYDRFAADPAGGAA